MQQLFNNSELIWDDKYFDINVQENDIRDNLDLVKELIINIFMGMRKKTIDTKFYYLGRNITKKFRPMATDSCMDDIRVSLSFDMFLTFEEIQNNYVDLDIVFGGKTITSIYEYFILSRSLINYDFDSCIPFMHKIDTNTTEILKYYNHVQDEIDRRNGIGANVKSARKV